MNRACRASIIISSYNYGRFLGQAIDSALNQSYPNTEVIVVDDGSLDNSREVIAGYGSCILPVLKKNGGQASAWNAGFAVSRGEVVFLVDSDDVLLPTAVERAMPFFQDATVAKVHWPLLEIDERGVNTGREEPRDALPEGDLRALVLGAGPDGYTWPATSGNAWARTFLAAALPMPEEEFKTSPDIYLSAIVPLFGTVQRISQPQSCWRLHEQNNRGRQSFDDRLGEMFQRAQSWIAALVRYGRAAGLDVDAQVLRANSWWCQIHRASQDLLTIVTPGESFVLVDNDAWTTTETLAGRRRIPFLERNGQYWGAPPDDDTAIRELEQLRQSGASVIAFAWPAFWWLDCYTGFDRHLRSTYPCIKADDRLIVFDLRTPA